MIVKGIYGPQTQILVLYIPILFMLNQMVTSEFTEPLVDRFGIWVLALVDQALQHFKMMVIWLSIIVLKISYGVPILAPHIHLAQEAHTSTQQQHLAAHAQQIVLLAQMVFRAQYVLLDMLLLQEAAGLVQQEHILHLVLLVSHAQWEGIMLILAAVLVLSVQLEPTIRILGVQPLLLVSHVQLEGIIQLLEALLALNVQLGAIIQTLEVQAIPRV